MSEHRPKAEPRILDPAIAVRVMAESRDCRVMEPDIAKALENDARAMQSCVGHRVDSRGWSIGKLIELLDAAIDSAGAQLARSAGLWADSPSQFDERERPARRRDRELPDTWELLEQPENGSGPDPV